MLRKSASLAILIALLLAAIGPTALAQENVTVEWWSHWANEPAKRAVIEKIAADYMAEHPDVTIEITWWDKGPLFDAVRSTMAAGEGAPDITTFDKEVPEWAEAGWLADLSEYLPWENFMPGIELDGTYPELGLTGNYKFNISSIVNMLFYNPDLFAELNIDVPEDKQFTVDEFQQVVQTCSDAGYAGVADAIGNRDYPAVWAVQYPLFTLVGPEEFAAYNNGVQSWDTDEARRVIEYTADLRDAGLWPASFSTMTVDEFHIYFHTQRRACMMFIPTWYTGRAFQPEENGGQDPNWHFGMLKYPSWEDGAANDGVWLDTESGYAVVEDSDVKETAIDILVFASQPKYGALWTAITNSPSAIKYDPEADWPSEDLQVELGATPGQWDWYWDEFNATYGDLNSALLPTARCGDFAAAIASALNEGVPLGLLSVDEAIDLMDSALCS